MKFKLIEDLASEQQDIGLGCKVLKVSRSGYYKWLMRPLSSRKIETERLWIKIKQMWEKSRKTYGAPRIHAELKDDKDFLYL